MDLLGVELKLVQQQKDLRYYRADQRLAVTDKRTGADLRCLRPHHAGVLEESRYDALGRRILLRARRGNGLNKGVIERYVWDGAQLLYEMHYPGEDSVPVEILEADTLTIRYERGCEEMKNCGEHPDSVKYPYRYSEFYGRVAYTHGLGIDRPLALTRAGYGRDTIFFEPFTVMPHVNWQGTYDIGTFATGTTEYSQEGARVEIDWPAKHTSTYLSRYSPDEPQGWFGSLIDQQRNPSGLLYRRNRYYEPEKGQFTQEDPIGLAGGINLYGFAEGDPVNYADPFGLKVCARSSTMRRHIENTYQVDIEWDKDGCVSDVNDVTARTGSERYAEFQGQFNSLVDSSVKISLSWAGSIARWYYGGSGVTCSAPGIGRCWIEIDAKQAGRRFGIDTPKGCSLAGPWGVGALIAHEFGHVLGYLATGGVSDQKAAITNENLFNRAAGNRHLRSYSCPPF